MEAGSQLNRRPETVVWWVSSRRMTVQVESNRTTGVIVKTAPVVRKFAGQPIHNLFKWMRQQGGFQKVRLPVSDRGRLSALR